MITLVLSWRGMERVTFVVDEEQGTVVSVDHVLPESELDPVGSDNMDFRGFTYGGLTNWLRSLQMTPGRDDRRELLGDLPFSEQFEEFRIRPKGMRNAAGWSVELR